jgi:hypothetical protein
MTKHLLYIVVWAIFVLWGCHPEKECNKSTVAGVNFGLVKQPASTTTGFIITPAQRLNDTLYSTGKDFLRSLPLVTSDNKTVFWFVPSTGEPDTLVVYHTMTLEFMDENCGFVPEFTIDTIMYSTNQIDTVLLINKLVTTDLRNENVKLVY